jgi:diadenosine tetraphosphate (Ap4A) HIT family hydrolase
MDVTCPLCVKVANVKQLSVEELVWEFPHSVVTLGPWQYHEGYCVVVARTHATELFDLPLSERTALIEEVTKVARAIHHVVQPRKINYECLGNQVPHMHWHLFPRQESDPNKLKPVWVELDAAERDPKLKERLQVCPRGRMAIIRALRENLEEP